MGIDAPFFRERIYHLACGNWNLKDFPVPESEFVKNEFAEGSFCHASYEKMLDAYTRLCERLQAEEWNDRDVEDLIHNLMSIQAHISMKMFEYGVFFARRAAICEK